MNAAAKYGRAFSLGMQQGLEYRMDVLLSMVSAAFQIFIQVFLWSAIYRKTGEEQMFGYTYSQMMLYTVMAGLLNRLLRTGFESEIAEDIKSGGLGKYIVRPVGYLPFRLFTFLGQKTAQTGLVSLLLLAVTAIVANATGLRIGTAQAGLFLPALTLAFVLNFILFYLVSAIAFWLTEIGFFFEAVRIVFIALSGGIFPLSVFGSRADDWLRYLPFRYTISFPVDVLDGRIAGIDAWTGLLVQAVWILVVGAGAQWIWRVGMRRFVAVGG